MNSYLDESESLFFDYPWVVKGRISSILDSALWKLAGRARNPIVHVELLIHRPYDACRSLMAEKSMQAGPMGLPRRIRGDSLIYKGHNFSFHVVNDLFFTSYAWDVRFNMAPVGDFTRITGDYSSSLAVRGGVLLFNVISLVAAAFFLLNSALIAEGGSLTPLIVCGVVSLAGKLVSLNNARAAKPAVGRDLVSNLNRFESMFLQL